VHFSSIIRYVVSLLLLCVAVDAFASGSFYTSYPPQVTTVNGVNSYNCKYDGINGTYHRSDGTCTGYKACVDPAIVNDNGDGCMLPDGVSCGDGMTWDSTANACVPSASPPSAAPAGPVGLTMQPFVSGLTGAVEIYAGVLFIASVLALVYATLMVCRRLLALLKGG
jgi:hypothetical protein